jgi:hypothetical protein
MKTQYRDLSQRRQPVLTFLIPAVCGVIVAGGLLSVVRRVSVERQRQTLAIGLAVAAGLYVVFALVAGATDWTRRNFARWLFEDYPRAIVATPRRWGDHVLD